MMVEFLSSLFNNGNDSDGYTQSEREALIEIILISTYIDKHIDLSEKKVMTAKVKTLSWDSMTSVENYVNQVIGGIRDAINNEENKKELLTSIQKRLVSESSKKSAYSLCEEILIADGKKTPEEIDLQEKLKSYIGL